MSDCDYIIHPYYPEIRILKEETWKAIPDYEEFYEASTWGRIKALLRMKRIRGGGLQPIPEHIVAQCNLPYGKKYVNLWKKGKAKVFQVHRLILFTFVGPCPEGMECCHEDDVPNNNYLENLRWDTRLNNCRDRESNGITLVGRIGNTWKLKGEYDEICRLNEEMGYTYKQLAKEYNVGINSISYAIRKVRRQRVK